MDRLTRLKHLVEVAYGASPDDYDEEVEEDLRPYYEGEREPDRFALVTDHDGKKFFLTGPSLAWAFSRGTEYVTDDIFTETPVEVVDLDDGTLYQPRWISLQWSPRSPREIPEGGEGA